MKSVSVKPYTAVGLNLANAIQHALEVMAAGIKAKLNNGSVDIRYEKNGDARVKVSFLVKKSEEGESNGKA